MEPELRFVAELTCAREVRRGTRLQTLWGGYGELHRVQVIGGNVETAIVKSVRPPRDARGSTSLSHLRKCRSYDVECAWFAKHAPRCPTSCRVPALLGQKVSEEAWWLVLEDLDAAGFDRRRRIASPHELEQCLAWLASFHATFLGVDPEGLWSEGTYWHLDTRPDELAAISDDELREAAPLLDARLTGAKFRTFVHGDAKEANFCFAEDGVAAVDFQYVGGGCGMRDVAYLLSGRWVEPLDVVEWRSLNAYFGYLRAALKERGSDVDADALESEWRSLYPIAYADFQRFLAGWAPEHWRTDREAQRRTLDIVRTL